MFSIQEQCSWIFLSVNGFAFTTLIEASAVCRFQISLSVVEANIQVFRAKYQVSQSINSLLRKHILLSLSIKHCRNNNICFLKDALYLVHALL